MRTWEILKKLFKSSGLQDELVESAMILIECVKLKHIGISEIVSSHNGQTGKSSLFLV